MWVAESGYAGLRGRAIAAVGEAGALAEEELLARVYGAVPPAGLRERLLAPLVVGGRLTRGEDGRWTLARRAASEVALSELAFSALALATTGPRPGRHRLVALAAGHVAAGATIGRFTARLRAEGRLPRYVAERARLGRDELDRAPSFAEIAMDLFGFLGDGPVVAQDAPLARAFLVHEARLAGWAEPLPEMLDLAALADAVLGTDVKPSLALIAARLGVAYVQEGRPEDEARALGEVVCRLLERAPALGLQTLDDLQAQVACRSDVRPEALPLLSTAMPRGLADGPGVYAFQDRDGSALYVGKARRLRERLAAYASRPLGATRRFEGLAAAVATVNARDCETDLEALVLEEREIRRLRPRFNTQRALHAQPTWLRLPPDPAPTKRKRRPAPPRLLLRDGPADDGAAYLGPFRNGRAAGRARDLARELFGLDDARRTEPLERYRERLQTAWRFLEGWTDEGVALARARLAEAVALRDDARARGARRLLAAALAWDPAGEVLPADPRTARYAVVRPGPDGVEAFLLDRAVCVGYAWLDADGDVDAFAAVALTPAAPRTGPEDRAVVLRWLGTQGASARLIYLAPGDEHHGAVGEAVAAVLEERRQKESAEREPIEA